MQNLEKVAGVHRCHERRGAFFRLPCLPRISFHLRSEFFNFFPIFQFLSSFIFTVFHFSCLFISFISFSSLPFRPTPFSHFFFLFGPCRSTSPAGSENRFSTTRKGPTSNKCWVLVFPFSVSRFPLFPFVLFFPFFAFIYQFFSCFSRVVFIFHFSFFFFFQFVFHPFSFIDIFMLMF